MWLCQSQSLQCCSGQLHSLLPTRNTAVTMPQEHLMAGAAISPDTLHRCHWSGKQQPAELCWWRVLLLFVPLCKHTSVQRFLRMGGKAQQKCLTSHSEHRKAGKGESRQNNEMHRTISNFTLKSYQNATKIFLDIIMCWIFCQISSNSMLSRCFINIRDASRGTEALHQLGVGRA